MTVSAISLTMKDRYAVFGTLNLTEVFPLVEGGFDERQAAQNGFLSVSYIVLMLSTAVFRLNWRRRSGWKRTVSVINSKSPSTFYFGCFCACGNKILREKAGPPLSVYPECRLIPDLVDVLFMAFQPSSIQTLL